MRINLKDLEETRSFYELELEREDLAGRERNSYLKALKIIEGFIEKEEAGEKGGKKMSRLVSSIYRIARVANDISKVASGDPKKITRRIKNKIIGRKLIRKIW